MKNTVKRFYIFSAVLIALTVFTGIICFAADGDSLPAGTGYTASGGCEVQDAELTDAVKGDVSAAIQETAESKSQTSDSEKSLGKSLGIGIGSGFVITVVVCVCISVSYKKHGTTEPYNYTKNAKLTMIDSSDVLINTQIEKRKINNE